MVCSFTALDAYFRIPPAPLRFEYIDGDLVALARLRDDLSYPGLPYADAITGGQPRLRFRCSDGDLRSAFTQLELRYDPERRAFDARRGVHATLHTAAAEPRSAQPELVLFEAAAMASRYGWSIDPAAAPRLHTRPGPEYQRDLLELVLTGAHPERGLDLLLGSGFMDDCWPELAGLARVDHVKDYHPEGDAWRHTMETFSYRKSVDLTLSLALLLHDTGKADAVAVDGRRFDRHSELGARTARTFLSRLGYSDDVARDVAFLVRYHMLPAALPRIPPSSLVDELSSPLFPTLLELYRCDELSTFRGPDGYYEACAAYRAYLRNARNPYRGPDGRKRPSKEAMHAHGI